MQHPHLAEQRTALYRLIDALTEVVNTVRLQDRVVSLVGRSRDRKPQAVLLPPDLADLIDAAGGLDAARDALRKLQLRDRLNAALGDACE